MFALLIGRSNFNNLRARQIASNPTDVAVLLGCNFPCLEAMLHAQHSSQSSVHDLPEESLKQILLGCRDSRRWVGDRNITEVCRQWRSVVDSFEDLIHILAKLHGTHYQLRTPQDAEAAEGCHRWCRLNGHKLVAVCLNLKSSWWITPCSPLSSLVNLQQIELSGLYTEMTCLDPLVQPLVQLTALRKLSICGVDGYSSLEPLTQLSGLEDLVLSDCASCLAGVSALTGLTSIVYEPKRQPDELEVEELSQLPKLQWLCLSNVWLFQVGRLKCSSLTSLEVDKAEGGLGVDGFKYTPELRKVSIFSYGFENLTPLSNLSHLQEIVVTEEFGSYYGAMNWRTLTALTSLTGLKVFGHPEMPEKYQGDKQVDALIDQLEANGVKVEPSQ